MQCCHFRFHGARPPANGSVGRLLAGVCSIHQLLQAYAVPVLSSTALSRLVIRRPYTMPFLVTTEDWAPSFLFRVSYRPDRMFFSGLLLTALHIQCMAVVTHVIHSPFITINPPN